MRILGTALLAVAGLAAPALAEPVARERIGVVDGDTVTIDGAPATTSTPRRRRGRRALI